MVERLQRVGPPEVVRPVRRRVHARLFVDAQDDVLPNFLRAAPVCVLLDVGPVARERFQQTPDAVARRHGACGWSLWPVACRLAGPRARA